MFKIYIQLFIVTLLINGCSKNNINLDRNGKPIQIINGTALAYAHMKNGTKLIKFTKEYKSYSSDDNIELIKITKDGFYPGNFNIPKNRFVGCITGFSAKGKNAWFCKSPYSKITKRPDRIFGAAVVNTYMAVLTAGVNLATASVVYTKEFDRDTFIKAIKENNLNEYRLKLIKNKGQNKL